MAGAAMQVQRHAEQYQAMTEMAEGVLARLAFIRGKFTDSKPKYMTESGMEKAMDFLDQHYPNLSSKFEKSAGFREIKDQLPTLIEELREVYYTFIDVLDFKESVYALLIEMSNAMTAMRFSMNPQRLIEFLDLITLYVQVHVMLTSVTNRRSLLVLFAAAMKAHHTIEDPNFKRLVQHFSMYDEPIPRIQQDLTSLAPRVADALVSFAPTFMKAMKHEAMRREGTLELLFQQDSHVTFPLQDSFHMELPYVGKMYQWVLWTCLVCPDALDPKSVHASTAEGLLRTALSSGFVAPVYRDEVSFIHHEYEAMAHRNGWNSIAKMVKESAHAAVNTSGRVHDLRRRWLRSALRSQLLIFRERPGLLAPKLQMVRGSLALAQLEINWYYWHEGVSPPRSVTKEKKGFNEAHFKDTDVSELFYLIDELAQLVRDHRRGVQRYYLEYLRKLDTPKIEPLIATAAQAAKLPDATSVQMRSIVDRLRALPDTEFESMLETLRGNWLKVTAALLSPMTMIKPAAVAALMQRMTLVVTHTRYVDELDMVLAEVSRFPGLWGYKERLVSLALASIRGTGDQPLHTMSIVKLFAAFHRVATKWYVAELETIGKECVAKTHQLLTSMSKEVLKLLGNIQGSKGMDLLHRQVAPEAAVDHLRRNAPAKPGSESDFSKRASLEFLRQWEKRMWQLVESFKSVPTLTVYQSEFRPLEYLREAVIKGTREFLVSRAVIISPDGAERIERPSVLKRKIEQFVTGLKSLENYVGELNINYTVQQMFLAQFYDREESETPQMDTLRTLLAAASKPKAGGGSATAAPLDAPHPKDMARVIGRIAFWYRSFVFQTLADSPVAIYSQTRQGFVTVDPAASFRAEHYLDLLELQALCDMIGPYGVRVIDNELLKGIHQKAAKVREALVANGNLLSKIFSETYWKEDSYVHKITHGPETIAAVTAIGNALVLRKLLRAALRQSVQQHTPLLWNSVHSALSQAPENLFHAKEYHALDSLAHDAGLCPDLADPALKAALQPLQASAKDAEAWDSLPLMMTVLVLRIAADDKAKYLPHLEAHANNAHNMALAVSQLIVHMKSISPLGQSRDQMQAMLSRYLSASALVLLRVAEKSAAARAAAAASGKAESGVAPNLTGAFIFLDKFLNCVPTSLVHVNVSERVMPYALLRAQYNQLWQAARSMDAGKPKVSAKTLKEFVRIVEVEDGEVTARTRPGQ